MLGLVAELKNLWAQIVAVGDAFILMVTNPIQFLKNFGAEIRELLDLLFGEGAGDSIFSAIADSVGAAWKGIKILITSVVGLAMKGFEAIGNAWKKVKGWFGAGEEEVNNAKNAAITAGLGDSGGLNLRRQGATGAGISKQRNDNDEQQHY